jgi:hypothetical protein
LALYEHHIPDENGENEKRQVTIVLHGAFSNHEILARTLARHLRSGPSPEQVVIFGSEIHASFIQDALKADSPFQARLAVAWGEAAKNKLRYGIVYKKDTNSHYAIGHEIASDVVKLQVAWSASMTAQAIFAKSGCLQVAPRGSHFCKTSTAHSDTFIRASNALVRSENTLTLAYFLLPFVAQNAKRILVDTSAIASVVYASCHAAMQVGALSAMPIIDSFQSYAGLSDADLEDIDNTLFVISASTSGNLARKAFGRGVKRHQLITLYLLSKDQQDQDALCVLRKSKTNPDGLDLLESWEAKDCLMCRNGSVPIQIGGDLFLTSLPETVSVMLLKKHLPEELQDTISRLAECGVFRAYRRIGERTAEISVDLESAFAATNNSAALEDFKGEWERILRRYLPANVTHIVYPDYPYAATLADGVNSFASKFIKANYSVTPARELVNTSAVTDGCAIVVTPCMDDPTELMGINRDLRNKIPGGTATYLFPILRASSPVQAKGIVTNLTFGDRGTSTYSLYRVHELYLPEDREINPWDRELNCLKILSDWIEEAGEDLPVEIINRRKLLTSATAIGLTDSLFWPDAAGKSLRIRTNFVLLPTNDGRRRLDQVDIFVVMSALLNNVRQLSGADSLRPNQHQRKVLSPSNFLRFNDGVIQAAILRAARDGELNYASTEDGVYSAAMADHILKMIDRAEAEEGEALCEFILAIAVGGLRLEKRDLEWVVKTIIEKGAGLPTVVFLLARGIESGILPLN